MQLQHKPLYPLASVIVLAKDLFNLDVDEDALRELCVVPLRDIGNFYTESVRLLHLIGKEGRMVLPSKTFHIDSVLGKACDFPALSTAKGLEYLNNPYKVIEYVNRSALVDYENLTNAYGEIIGHVKGGKYYDKFWNELSKVEAVKQFEDCHSTQGHLYQVPVAYHIEGDYIVFEENTCGKSIRIDGVRLREDESGLPLVDEPTKVALACYMHFVKVRIRYFDNGASKEQLATAEEEYKMRKNAAKTDMIINENLRQKILKILNSYQRSSYSQPYFDKK